jgi:hypothetical protein
MARHRGRPGTSPSRRTGPLALTVRYQKPNHRRCHHAPRPQDEVKAAIRRRDPTEAAAIPTTRTVCRSLPPTLAGVVVPLAALKSALDVHELALRQELAGDLGQPVPGDARLVLRPLAVACAVLVRRDRAADPSPRAPPACGTSSAIRAPGLGRQQRGVSSALWPSPPRLVTGVSRGNPGGPATSPPVRSGSALRRLRRPAGGVGPYLYRTPSIWHAGCFLAPASHQSWISGHAEMALISHHPGAKAPVLLRRLMVSCPVTAVSVDTGYELTEIPRLGRGPQLLVDCLECGQDHSWHLENAFLEP